MQKFHFCLILFLFFIGEIISQEEYKWIYDCTLYEIPRIPKEKITRSFKELCEPNSLVGREPNGCQILRRLLNDDFKRLLWEKGEELREFWNDAAVPVLKHVYGTNFPELEENFGIVKTLHLFDSIDEDSVADYKLEFYKLAVFSMLYAQELNKMPNNSNLKTLSKIVKKFVKVIETHTINQSIDETSKWTLTQIGSDPDTHNSIESLRALNKQFKESDQKKYNEIRLLIQTLKTYMMKITCVSPLEEQKNFILRTLKLYKGITRFCFEAILMDHYRESHIADQYEGMTLGVNAEYNFDDDGLNKWVRVSYHWVKDTIPKDPLPKDTLPKDTQSKDTIPKDHQNVPTDTDSLKNEDLNIVIKAKTRKLTPTRKPESSHSRSASNLGKRHAESSINKSTPALEYLPAGNIDIQQNRSEPTSGGNKNLRTTASGENIIKTTQTKTRPRFERL